MADLTEICAVLKNYFLKDYINYSDIHRGNFTISGHTFAPLDFTIKEGQYFRIKGSDLNDGVWLNTTDGLKDLRDESFEGEIWLMAVPRSFEKLANDINAWRAKNEAVDSANMSVFQSETVQGVYSYTKGNSGGSGGMSWLDNRALKSRALAYRRMSEL